MEFLLNLIYPNVCGFCGNICKECLCKKCEIKWTKKMQTKVDDYSFDDGYWFEKHAYAFKYEGEIRDFILNYKFNEKAYLYKTFAKILLKNKNVLGILKECDIIIPVPIHKNRKRQRGYNQSELISREIARQIKNLKFDKNVLIKQKDVKPQSSLSKNDRQENIKHAYCVKKSENIKGKKIVLLDDIFTTGSTVNECSKMLKEAGVSKINILTIAKD